MEARVVYSDTKITRRARGVSIERPHDCCGDGMAALPVAERYIVSRCHQLVDLVTASSQQTKAS
jgi:hypothetical protein